MTRKVAIVIGSDSDLPVVSGAIKQLKEFGIPFAARVISAHRTPAQAEAFARGAADAGFGVIIAAAGKAAHLGGVIATHTTLPVIGLPISASILDGLDSLLAIVQMPPGVPVATVAIDGAQNAAILAAQILALSDGALAEKLKAHKFAMAEKVMEKDRLLQEEMRKPQGVS
jgi:5-(carboxyamino)imidazole ribonucleotide mutase